MRSIKMKNSLICFFKSLRPYFCPLSGALLSLLLLLSFFSGYLFLRPEEKVLLSAEEEYRRLEDALLEANRSVARARTEEEKTPHRASVIFYKMALEHGFPVWESDFYSEVLHRFAALSVIPEKSEDQKAEAACLKKILFEEDREGFLKYLEEKMSLDPALSEEEMAIRAEQNKLLFSKDLPASGGREELLEDIFLLRESLLEGENRFHLAAKSAPLKKSEANRLERLLEIKLLQYRSGRFSFSPANDQTLRSCEAFLALALVLILIFLWFRKEKEEETLPLSLKIASRASVFFAFLFLAAAVLFITASHFAPDSANPAFFFTQKAIFAVPYFAAILIRLFFRALCFLPFVLLSALFREKAFAAKAAALFCTVFHLFSVLAPFFGKIGICIGLLASPAEALFPSLSRYTLLPPSPIFPLLLLALFCAIPIVFLRKKKRT